MKTRLYIHQTQPFFITLLHSPGQHVSIHFKSSSGPFLKIILIIRICILIKGPEDNFKWVETCHPSASNNIIKEGFDWYIILFSWILICLLNVWHQPLDNITQVYYNNITNILNILNCWCNFCMCENVCLSYSCPEKFA
jgi:hypothetical protein